MSHAACRVHLGLNILVCLGGGSLYAWSGYLPAVRAQFSVNNATASMVFSLALFSFTLGVLLGPLLIAKVRARFQLPLLAGLAALSLGISSASTGFAGFVISYGVCFGFSSGALYNYAISRASASANATLVIPLYVAAFGLGGAVFGPLQVWLTSVGWALWSSVPALVCLAMAGGFALVFRSPLETNNIEQTPVNLMIRPYRTIVNLGIIFAAGSCSGLIVLGFASQILPGEATGVGLASLAIFLAAIGNTLGRLSSILTAGCFGPARAIAGALVLSMMTLACLIFTSSPHIIVGLLFLVAFAYGQLAATMPVLVKSQVSTLAFSGAFGWVFVGWGVAGLVGPWTAGWLLDVTGTVQVSLILCIAIVAIGLWLVLDFAKVPNAKEDC